MNSEVQNQNLISLGLNIRNIRKSKNLSQEKLSLEANLDRSYIGGIERGERNVSINTLCIIAQALNVSVSGLVYGLPICEDEDGTL